MAGTSRIDELRKKFDENPRRYFAPLANEYRKIGDFEQAIFICQEFLPQQPGHMSGHIVYGQALFESGRHDEARSVFETALALDPENLIALRHLGDIARAIGDNDTARAWYRRVLESDPRNEEIAGILTSLDSADAAGQASLPSSSPGAAPGGASPTVESAIGAAAGGEDTSSAHPDPAVTNPLATAPLESNFDDIAKLFTSAAPSAATGDDESLNLIHEGEDVIGGVVGAKVEESPLSATRERAAPAETAPTAAPAAAESTESVPASFNLPFLEGLTSAEPTAAPPAATPPSETPARAPAADANTAFVTETMAELYVKQGHFDQAVDVYRQLVQLHPNDVQLAGRLRALEQRRVSASRPETVAAAPASDSVAEAGPTIREFLGTIAEFRPRSAPGPVDIAPSVDDRPAPVPNERQATRASGGTVAGSLSSLFAGAEQNAPSAAGRDEFAVPPPRDRVEPAPLPGRPSTPAATELSLDHVFRHATPASGAASHSSFSFDQFFSQQAQKDVAASDAETSTADSAGLSDDIQQFNAWLEGLKKT